MIPSFDLNGLLPPFVGPTPILPAAQAPFRTDILELSHELGTSPARRVLLEGLIRYRNAIRAIGFLNGYQILNGSFCENCELIRGNDPGDIDAITFVKRPAAHKADASFAAFIATHIALLEPSSAKATFGVHSFIVDLDAPAELTIPMSIYFVSLFSHQKSTRQWKGTLRIDLQSSVLDDAALKVISA